MYEWPLINDNITQRDKEVLIEWLQEHLSREYRDSECVQLNFQQIA